MVYVDEFILKITGRRNTRLNMHMREQELHVICQKSEGLKSNGLRKGLYTKLFVSEQNCPVVIQIKISQLIINR